MSSQREIIKMIMNQQLLPLSGSALESSHKSKSILYFSIFYFSLSLVIRMIEYVIKISVSGLVRINIIKKIY